jgi:hypothetical protein
LGSGLFVCRTLARRLRRAHALRLGFARGAALVKRTEDLRLPICAHWALDDLIGGRITSFRDAVQAAALANVVDAGELEELNPIGEGGDDYLVPMNMRPADDEEAFGAKFMAQPSRVPSSPLGRKIRISTRNR